ncbi:MAG: hypothetical protein N4A76_01935 [Firmicutes bacterium]|jgi:uncharacterized HAD superfamily protein|nr:hypothetical protein [Bacillota bacterium]
MKLNICIDIDGTVTDPYYWLEEANGYFRSDLKPDEVVCYDIHTILGIPRKEYDIFYDKYGEKIHREALVREEASTIVNHIHKNNKIHFVTARDPRMTTVTYEWLDKHDFIYHGVHLLGSHHKIEKARELECDIFIEDRYENAVELAKEGFKVLLVDCTYNRYENVENVTRVYDWEDIYKEIIEYKLDLLTRAS